MDDEPALLRSLKLSLGTSGYSNVELCSESSDVLSKLKDKQYSLIVLDNMMPGLSGMELLPQIKQLHPMTPVIMLTAMSDTQLIVEAMKAGAFDYLVKPVDKSLFVTQVERALHFFSMHQKNTDLNSSLKKALGELEIKSQTQDDLVAKLTKSTYQLRSILEALPAVILLVDTKGNVAQCNEQVKQYFGMDFLDVVFQPFEKFKEEISSKFENPSDLFNVMERAAKHLDETKPNASSFEHQLQNRLNAAPPSQKVFSVVAVPVSPMADNKMGTIWVFRDITDMVKAEEQLQTIVNASPVPLLISKVEDGTFLYVNNHLSNLLGVDKETLLTMKTTDFYYDPGQREKIIADLLMNKKVVNQELKVRTSNGSYIWAVLNLVFSRLYGKDVVVGGLSDITDQINTIETLENTKKELLDAQSRLVQSEKMASLGNLVAGIAHEINNPVGAVSSSANAASRAIDKIMTHIYEGDCSNDIKGDIKARKVFEIIKDCHNIITEGCSRISNIVKSLKNFSRIDEAEYLKADIHEGLNSTLDLVNHQFKNRIVVIKNFGNIPQIDCYPNQLNQVFMNMLVNAGQAISECGTITLTTRFENREVIITIADTGKGIEKSKLPFIFDPGYTTKGVGIGTGLGLSISYNIIEKHKGRITVDSEVGKGTSFHIHLPVVSKLEPAAIKH